MDPGEVDLSPHRPAHCSRVTRGPRLRQVAERESIIRCLLVWALGAKWDTNDYFLLVVLTILIALLMGTYMD